MLPGTLANNLKSSPCSQFLSIYIYIYIYIYPPTSVSLIPVYQSQMVVTPPIPHPSTQKQLPNDGGDLVLVEPHKADNRCRRWLFLWHSFRLHLALLSQHRRYRRGCCSWHSTTGCNRLQDLQKTTGRLVNTYESPLPPPSQYTLPWLYNVNKVLWKLAPGQGWLKRLILCRYCLLSRHILLAALKLLL